VKSVPTYAVDENRASQRRLRVRVHGCILLVVAVAASASRAQEGRAYRDADDDVACAAAATASMAGTGATFSAPPGPPTETADVRTTVEDDGLSETAPGSALDDAGAKPKDWQFTLAPYLWLLSVSADIKAGPISTGADVCVTDLLQNLDMIAQLRFEGLHKERWGFFLDGTYLGLSTEASAKIGPFRLRGRDVDAELDLAWLDVGAMYRFGESGRSFDAFLGGRVAHVSSAVSIGPFLDSADQGDFVSPVIGGRVEWAFSERWVGWLSGEVGGFGVGQGADLFWGATASVGYRLSRNTTLALGYRVYDWDYGQGRRDLHLMFHGPIVGLVFRF